MAVDAEQLAAFSCVASDLGDLVAETSRALRPQGYRRVGNALVLPASEGRVLRYTFARARVFGTSCAFTAEVSVLQMPRDGLERAPADGWNTVLVETFVARPPMTGFYSFLVPGQTEIVITDPTSEGYDALRAGLVDFGRIWSERLVNPDAVADLLRGSRPDQARITAEEYLTLRALVASKGLGPLDAAMRTLDERIPADAWMRDSDGLKQIIHEASESC